LWLLFCTSAKIEKGGTLEGHEEAKRVGPPAPPKPAFRPGGSEDEYKKYMVEKYEFEAWENQVILLGRKLRQQSQAVGR